MRNLLALFLILCLCIFIGCLGMSGSSGSIGVPSGQISSAVLSGRVYFADSQLYGGIPIAVRDILGKGMATVLTDSAGYFAFPQLAAGIYDLVAMTGESEVIFARGVQVDGVNPQQVQQTALLGIRDVVIDKINPNSFHIKFHANRASRASIEYGPLGGFQQTVTIGQAGVTTHETTISGLLPDTEYEVSLFITGDDGQNFVSRGLFVATPGLTGPKNLSVSINAGAYETRSQNVTLYLEAENCSQMRISESFDMSDTVWVTYSQTYAYTLKNISAGTKRVYVQFRDANGVTSPVQSDGILMSNTGYVGVWINDGSAITNSTAAVIKTIFPGATHMQLSSTADFLNSFWEVYVEAKSWKLTAGDGLKTIFCRFRGGQANPDEVFVATILLDTTAPEVLLKINNGSTVTATTSVTLTFSFSVSPTQMKLSNTTAPASSAAWVSFKDTVSWTLPVNDGEKTVYGIFRDGAGNEYGPISSVITLDSVAPINNTIAIRLTEDSTSTVASFALTASLPVFLHFAVTDTSSYQGHYAITEATTTPPVTFSTVGVPFTPVALGATQLPVGSHKIWTRFTDLAGNAGFFQTTSIKIDGPQIIIAPTTTTLKSGREQQFTATLKNVDIQDVGSIRWRVIDGSGTIDTNGLFTAPAPIYNSSVSTIRADSTLISSLYNQVTVNLATSVEMLFRQQNGQYTYDAINDQVAPGGTINTAIQILHSSRGYEISKQPGAGSVSISSPIATTYGMTATLTYAAPAVAPAANPVTIGVRSLDAPTTAAGTLTFLISTGPNLALNPTSGDAQRNTPLGISATVTGTASTTMTWTIAPADLGSFSPTNPAITTITTGSPDHSIVFYASNTIQIRQASVTAAIDGASRSCKITVYPPVRFQIEPAATSSLPIISPMTFKAQGFDYLLGAATETVTWEFKNAAFTDFMPADGKTYLDRGSLKVIDGTTAEYRRPTLLPSLSDSSATDSILIRATSIADPLASATAVTAISPKVVVEIFDSVEKVASITQAATVAEVGKIQFFAGVTPSVIGNTSISWTVNGTSGSTQYGTIDSNGLYTAPDQIYVNEVTVRATSNYDTTAFAAVKVSLSDFWQPKRTNMFDSITGEAMPVTSLLVSPRTPSSSDFTVFAGTDGYGVWYATFSGTPGDTSGGDWQPTGLNKNSKTSGEYQVNHLIMDSFDNIYAGTANGIWHIDSVTKAAASVAANVSGNPELPSTNFLKLSISDRNLFATTPNGVYKIELESSTNANKFTNFILILDVISSYYTAKETRNASPSPDVEAYYETLPNPINGILYAIAYDDYTDRLYAGGESGVFLSMGNTNVTNFISLGNQPVFESPAPSLTTTSTPVIQLSLNQPKQANPPMVDTPLDLAIDVINRNTIWAATVGGVYRSVDNGMTWEPKLFSTGSVVNTRAIIVDPTNTINVLAGSEDGLYRSTNAGTNWIRVRSGLGNHKTITSLTQAAGLAGARRKVWVGTAGGVFMGKQSLDLE